MNDVRYIFQEILKKWKIFLINGDSGSEINLLNFLIFSFFDFWKQEFRKEVSNFIYNINN